MTPIALIHVAKKQLGLDDDDYRALLERVTGKRSCRDMSPAQLSAVVDEFRRLGFTPAAPTRSGTRRATGPYAGKLQALWISAWNLGIVKNCDDAAMIAFVERQTGIAHTRFLTDAASAAKAIEGLKSWMAREGGVDWSGVQEDLGVAHAAVDDPRYRIVVAQWRKLIAIGAVKPFIPGSNDLTSLEAAYGYKVTGIGAFHYYQGDHWIALMNALGKKLRGATMRTAEQKAAAA